MPQLSFHVSDLQQKTKSATKHELVHANRVLDWAQQWVNRDKIKLRFLPLKGDVNVNLVYTEQQDSRYQKQQARMQKLGLAAIHDASWGGQPDMGSQMGYAIMLGSTQLYDGPTVTHLLEWRSAKIDRKVASTLAAEANSASQAYDRGTYARVLLYELERGRDKHWKECAKKFPSVWERIADLFTTTRLSQHQRQKRSELHWTYLMFVKELNPVETKYVGYLLITC